MRRGVRLTVATGVVTALLAATIAGYAYEQYVRPGPLLVAAHVIVPRGASVADIAELLSTANVIFSPLLFRLAARVEHVGSSLRAGEYQFPAGTSMRQAVAMLRSGDVIVRKLTVPEGLSSRQVIALLGEAPGLEGEVVAFPAEGALLPATYNYSWGDGRNEMVRRMSGAMGAVLDELWASRDAGLPLVSPRDAVILASIVEKETALAFERPRVAAVFLNRLRAGMKLQADPTVAYAVWGGIPPPRTLGAADLQINSPYNTYVYEGLPPGPIANPGRASLEAVLRPARCEDLFFVADGSGGHSFSRTLEEHNRNVARWRRLNDGAGGGD